MTTLICDFQDIVGERVNGYATLSAGDIRIGQDAPTVVLRSPSPPEQVIEGEATFENVEPGPAVLQLYWDRQSATLRFTVPNTPETVTLSECVEQTLEYTPPIINRGLDLIEGARDEALGQVEGAVNERLDDVFGRKSTNLFNADKSTSGVVLPPGSAIPETNTMYAVSEQIPVTESSYTFAHALRVTFLDADGAYVVHMDRGSDPYKVITLTNPDVAYMRLSVRMQDLDIAQLNAGSTLLPYEPGGVSQIPAEHLDLSGVQPAGDYIEGKATPEDTTFFNISTNLFDTATITPGVSIPKGGAEPTESSTYVVSDFIPVTPGESYTYAGVNRITLLDAGGQWVFDEATAERSGTVVAPATARWARLSISVQHVSINDVQLNLGPVLLPYEPGGAYKIKSEFIDPIPDGRIAISPNLLNIDALTEDAGLSGTTGEETVNVTQSLTGWIPVEPLESFYLSGVGDRSYRYAFYDSSRVFISSQAPIAPSGFSAPQGAAWMRLSVPKAGLTGEPMLNRGDTALPYQPFWVEVAGAKIGTVTLPEGIVTGPVTPEKTTFFQGSSNLFDRSEVTLGAVIPANSATPIANLDYAVSDPIPVKPGEVYSYAGLSRGTFLDSSGGLAGFATADATYTGTWTAPAGATHVRLSLLQNRLDTAQLNLGPALLPYEPGGGESKIPFHLLDLPDTGLPVNIAAINPRMVDTAGLSEIYDAPTIEAQPGLPTTEPEDVYGWFDQLVTDHPDYVTRRDLGLSSDGATRMYAYTLKPLPVPNTVDGGVLGHLIHPLPTALLVSGTHGYEEIGVYSLWRMAKALCEEWDTSPVLDAMRWNFEIIIVPLVNPWGWKPENVGRQNANGVDLARNFAEGWAPSTPGTSTYGGPTALSEPETQAVDALMAEVSDRCVLGGSFHNFSATTDRKWLTIWQAAPTPMMLNLGKKLIARMSRKWRSEHSWITVPEVYFGYSDMGAPAGSEGRAFISHGIPGSTFETTQRLFLDGGTGIQYSADAMTLGYEAVVNYIAMGLAEGLRLKQ